jgi:serine/threonine protein phosphatase PrpC
MNYYICGYSDKGNSRKHNEDSILIDHEVINSGAYEATVAAPFITAVCDGVGGENAGELASKLCLQHLSIIEYSSLTDMKITLLNIHGKIKKSGVYADNAANMQTTLCALAVDENGKALCVNVGDSRMYRYVNGTIRQISIDQSYSQFLYEKGQIDDISDLQPEYRNAIISSIGSTKNEPDVAQTPLVSEFGAEPDDMIIIVSDGVSDYVSEAEFEVGLGLDMPILEKITALARLAIMNGGTDNVSIVGVKPYFDDEELRTLTSAETVEETVNVAEVLAETEELGDILNIDVNEIIGKGKKEKAAENTLAEDFGRQSAELMRQAEESLERLLKL